MKDKEIDVSVIVLVYNQERYLRKALDSILEQKINFKYEIIISDDCSTDNSPQILKEYLEKYPEVIKVFFQKNNIGVTKNHYFLLKNCKGKYIAQLEGDDFWIDKNKLQKQYNILEKTNYIGVVHSNLEVNHNDIIIGKYKIYEKEKELKINELLKKGMLFHTATLMYRNIFKIKEYNIIWQAHQLISDFTIAFILLDLGKILYIPNEMSVYRRNDKIQQNVSNILAKNLPLNYIKILEAYDMIGNYYNKKYNMNNLKVLRTEELLCNYYLNRNFEKKDLKKYMKNIKKSIIIVAYIRTFKRGIKYILRKFYER